MSKGEKNSSRALPPPSMAKIGISHITYSDVSKSGIYTKNPASINPWGSQPLMAGTTPATLQDYLWSPRSILKPIISITARIDIETETSIMYK